MKKTLMHVLLFAFIFTVFGGVMLGAPDRAAAQDELESFPERDLYRRDPSLLPRDLNSLEPPQEAWLQTEAASNAASRNEYWSRTVYSRVTNTGYHLHVADETTYNIRSIFLTSDPHLDVTPRLNRSCETIAYAEVLDYETVIYSIPISGGSKFRLSPHNAYAMYPNWAPNNQQVAYQMAYANGLEDIYVVSSAGGTPAALTSHPDYDGMPAYSPDGSKIAFISRRTGGFRVWVMNADGSNQVQLGYEPYSAYPHWSQDGTKIAYSADADGDGFFEIWHMNADGSGATKIDHSATLGNVDLLVRGLQQTGNDKWVVGDLVNWIYYEGKWYWTSAKMFKINMGGGSYSYIGSGDTNWYHHYCFLDSYPPVTEITPLPHVSPASFNVLIRGWDSSSELVERLDVQMRIGANGIWTDWFTYASPFGASAAAKIYTGIGGQTYYFRSRGLDVFGNLSAWTGAQAWTTVEAIPPIVNFAPMPRFVYRLMHKLSWSGWDPGGSGIKNYELEYKHQSSPTWGTLPPLTQNNLGFYATQWGNYSFRIRGTDYAQNTPAWPESGGDAEIIFYDWGIMGKFTDLAGSPLSQGVVEFLGPTLYNQPSETDGAYWVLGSPQAYPFFPTLNWSKPGYASLPETTLEIESGNFYQDIALPPFNDLLLDGDFENAGLPAEWFSGGPAVLTQTAEFYHSGANALAAASPGVIVNPAANWPAPAAASPTRSEAVLAVSRQVSLPGGMPTPILSFWHLWPESEKFSSAALVLSGAGRGDVVVALAPAPDWQRTWVDLTDWAGETLTITIQGELNPGEESFFVLDEIHLGSVYPDLQAVAVVPDVVTPGQAFTLTLDVENIGYPLAAGTTLTLTLPETLELISAELPFTQQGAQYLFSLGDIAGLSKFGAFAVRLVAAPDLHTQEAQVGEVRVGLGTPEVEMENNTIPFATLALWRLFVPAVNR